MPADEHFKQTVAALVYGVAERLHPTLAERFNAQDLAVVIRDPKPGEPKVWTKAAEIWGQYRNPHNGPSDPAPFLFGFLIAFGFSTAMISSETTTTDIAQAADRMAQAVVAELDRMAGIASTSNATPVDTVRAHPDPLPDSTIDLHALRERRLRR